jgi:hypothetical protein
MTTLSIVPGEAAWRARAVRYYAGDWAEIVPVLREFSLVPFNAGEAQPASLPHGLSPASDRLRQRDNR